MLRPTRSARAATRGAARSPLARALAALRPVVVEAHCDTEEGPAVMAGRRALATGNVNHALPWIPAAGEAELQQVFARTLRVRALGGEAAEVADRLFLETLVRIHRMGEGVGFTGIKPAGTPVDPVVAAADAALVTGDVAPLLALLPDERRDRVRALFAEARARREHDVDDVAAARAAVDAYVAYVKDAEGHDHGHGEHHYAGHDHGEHHHAGHDHAGRDSAEHHLAGHGHGAHHHSC